METKGEVARGRKKANTEHLFIRRGRGRGKVILSTSEHGGI